MDTAVLALFSLAATGYLYRGWREVSAAGKLEEKLLEGIRFFMAFLLVEVAILAMYFRWTFPFLRPLLAAFLITYIVASLLLVHARKKAAD